MPRWARQSIRRHVLAGLVDRLVLAGGVGGWAATMALSGALIAQGSIVVDSNVKKVQHPTGGVVGELNVRDGDRVKPGDILVAPRRYRDPRQSRPSSPKASTSSMPARRVWSSERDGARHRRVSGGLARRTQRSQRSHPSWMASASCSNCAARRGSARRISCGSGSSSSRKKSPG